MAHLLRRDRSELERQLPLGAGKSEVMYMVIAGLVLAFIAFSFWTRTTQ